jgi:hypothetical protein
MKKQTAAQIRAAQAVVDREEAIEAERERRRAERAEREQLAASERRAAFLASVRVSSRPFVAWAKGFGESLLVLFVVIVVGLVIAVFLDAFVVPSFNGYPLSFEQRVEVFFRTLPAALGAVLEFLIFTAPKMILPLFPYMANVIWAFIPWYGLLGLVLLCLKFVVFPLVRFLIRKVRN